MDLPLLPRALTPVLLLALGLGGCMTGKSSIGELEGNEASSSDGSDGTGSTASTSSETTASPGTDDHGSEATSGSSGGAPPLSCPPTSQCSVPLECEPEGFEECGGILGRSDEDGCPRQPCSGPGECPDGFTCFLPNDWTTCGYHTCFDDPRTGACECGFGADCNDNGLCVPDDAGLPPDTNGPAFCGQRADAISCNGAAVPSELGACRWYEGWQMPAGAACEERVEISQCVFVSAFKQSSQLTSCPSDETLTPMVLDEGGQLTVLLVDVDEQPSMIETSGSHWLPCNLAGTEPECECGCP